MGLGWGLLGGRGEPWSLWPPHVDGQRRALGQGAAPWVLTLDAPVCFMAVEAALLHAVCRALQTAV